MSDSEVVAEPKKGRGRPKQDPEVQEAKKRPAAAAPAAENGNAPPKRGRGRPPKGSKKGAAAKVVPSRTQPGRGRGRPKAKKNDDVKAGTDSNNDESADE